MNLDSLTIPPELFYSNTSADTRKPKKIVKITPADITKVNKSRKHFKTHSRRFKLKSHSANPILGRVGKVKRSHVKKKLLKKAKIGGLLKEKSTNILSTINNNLTVKLRTKKEEQELRKEIIEKEEVIKKRLYVDENYKRKKVKGSSFKFFKSKNVRESGDEEPSTEDDDDLFPEIRDFSATEASSVPSNSSNLIDAQSAFEDDDNEHDGNTLAVIETLLSNLEEPDGESAPTKDSDTSGTSLNQLIDTLEGTEEKKSSEAENPKPKLKLMGFGDNQLQIDAGQKKFGLVECKQCGFSYNVSSTSFRQPSSCHF